MFFCNFFPVMIGLFAASHSFIFFKAKIFLKDVYIQQFDLNHRKRLKNLKSHSSLVEKLSSYICMLCFSL